MAVCAVLLLTSCTGKKDYSSEEYAGQSSLQIKKLNKEEQAYIQGKNICVVLGYGYEDEEIRDKIKAKLEQNFGIENEEKEGLITLYFYPDNFKKYGPVRISQLAENLEEKKLAGIVIYGAPEGMNIPLATLQDKREAANETYPVFNLFSQDDILGSESTSDFVLDHALVANASGLEENEEVSNENLNFDSDALIIRSISTIISSKGIVPKGPELKNYVSDILGKDKKISYYHDAETGLQSVNHFFFE